MKTNFICLRKLLNFPDFEKCSNGNTYLFETSKLLDKIKDQNTEVEPISKHKIFLLANKHFKFEILTGRINVKETPDQVIIQRPMRKKFVSIVEITIAPRTTLTADQEKEFRTTEWNNSYASKLDLVKLLEDQNNYKEKLINLLSQTTRSSK